MVLDRASDGITSTSATTDIQIGGGNLHQVVNFCSCAGDRSRRSSCISNWSCSRGKDEALEVISFQSISRCLGDSLHPESCGLVSTVRTHDVTVRFDLLHDGNMTSTIRRNTNFPLGPTDDRAKSRGLGTPITISDIPIPVLRIGTTQGRTLPSDFIEPSPRITNTIRDAGIAANEDTFIQAPLAFMNPVFVSGGRGGSPGLERSSSRSSYGSNRCTSDGAVLVVVHHTIRSTLDCTLFITSSTQISRTFELIEDDVGSLTYCSCRTQTGHDICHALQFLDQVLALNVDITDRLLHSYSQVQQALLPTGICPLGNTIASTVVGKVLVCTIVNSRCVCGIYVSQFGFICILKVGGN